MGACKSKISRTVMIAMIVALCLSSRQDSGATGSANLGITSSPVQTAGFGGVLVSKRMKMILGFVQTLPV